MRAVQQPHERAVGDRAGHVAQLRQPVQPQLADAREVGLGKRRARPTMSAEQRRAPRSANRVERRHAERASRPSRCRMSSCAPIARERLVHLDRRPIAAALVEHVGGDRRQPLLAGRIVGGAAADEQHERDDRHRSMARRSTRAGRWRSVDFSIAGNVNGRDGPGSGSRERSTVGAQALTRPPPASEPGSARSVRPARHDAQRRRAARRLR